MVEILHGSYYREDFRKILLSITTVSNKISHIIKDELVNKISDINKDQLVNTFSDTKKDQKLVKAQNFLLRNNRATTEPI